jgi:hypothetical protein
MHRAQAECWGGAVWTNPSHGDATKVERLELSSGASAGAARCSTILHDAGGKGGSVGEGARERGAARAPQREVTAVSEIVIGARRDHASSRSDGVEPARMRCEHE